MITCLFNITNTKLTLHPSTIWKQDTEPIPTKEDKNQRYHQFWNDPQDRERNKERERERERDKFESQDQETKSTIQHSKNNNKDCSTTNDSSVQNRVQTDTIDSTRNKKEDEEDEEDNTSIQESIWRIQTGDSCSDSKSDNNNNSDSNNDNTRIELIYLIERIQDKRLGTKDSQKKKTIIVQVYILTIINPLIYNFERFTLGFHNQKKKTT